MPYNIAYAHEAPCTVFVTLNSQRTAWSAITSTRSPVWLSHTEESYMFAEKSRRSGKSHVPVVQCKTIVSPHIPSTCSDQRQKLIDRGHKVIVITHAYAGRTGVRYLTNGLKVYYVPFLVIYRETSFPTVFSFFPIFRNIVIRERIEIVHGHASLSSLCNEAILHARTMGLRTVFTDHSLFGFADAGSILTNKLLKFTLSDVDHVICVSHTWYES
jgi:hypothetical protein